MTEVIRSVVEELARKTSRRGLFSRGAEMATGTLLGVAAGTIVHPYAASAGGGTVCIFPGPPCPCDTCTSGGTCGKPCVFNQCCYASGCWVSGSVTCCDCDCRGYGGVNSCGCGSDYHNNPQFCP